MTVIAWWVLAAALAGALYPYLFYPVLLQLVGLLKKARPALAEPPEWPRISITIPAYNEEAVIARTLDRILETDYPAERRQVLVVSDCSSDRTDEIVRGYAGRGVELLRMPQRTGKTGAENAAQPLLHGDIVMNTDASVQLHPDALRHLAAAFTDPTVGLASSRDVSVASVGDSANVGEGEYVGYEMWVRRLETRVYGIVGASGSLYAIRASLHRTLVPEALSRDFAAALNARELGLRAVSIDQAICFVPRGASLHKEYRRKVRTMARGLETLWYKKHLLDPFRFGVFAWMLWSHKLMRWLVPWALAVGGLAVAVAAIESGVARVLFATGLVVLGLAAVGWMLPEDRGLPRLVAIPAYIVSSLMAGLHAWIKALSGELNPLWEPTRRAPKVS